MNKQRPEKRASSWEELLTSLPEVEWVVAEIQKRGDAENEKNENYKTDEGNRKGKYKHLAWCNLIYKTVFSLSGKDLQRQL